MVVTESAYKIKMHDQNFHAEVFDFQSILGAVAKAGEETQ